MSSLFDYIVQSQSTGDERSNNEQNIKAIILDSTESGKIVKEKLETDYLVKNSSKLIKSEDDIELNNAKVSRNEGKENPDTNIDNYIKNAIREFISLVRNETIETGFNSTSELFLKEKLSENPLLTKEWLNKTFLENFRNPDILIKILFTISNIDYNIINPQGPTMALAASNHQDDEVKEYAIRCFENWANPESLKTLKYIKYPTKWLQDYIEEVIQDLEEELS